MASGLSTAERNRYLTLNYKTNTVYAAACTVDPADAAVMSGKEATGSAYARTVIVFNDAAAAGTISNTTAVEFPAASGGNWGDISHLAICTTDVEDADTCIASGPLTATKTIDDGDQLVFAIGNIDVAIAVQA